MAYIFPQGQHLYFVRKANVWEKNNFKIYMTSHFFGTLYKSGNLESGDRHIF